MRNNLTLQINSLEALERLIGGDSEIEIDIRNNVVQKFAEKHLKAVANSEMMKNLESSIRNSLYESSGYKKNVSSKIKKEIDTIVDNIVSDNIKRKMVSVSAELIDNANQKIRQIADDIEKQDIVNKAINKAINEKVDKKFNDFLTKFQQLNS
jgi:hypothetical protein